ncbi:MAG: ABC transporter substrate-binding protein, partial [Steroidobacteraceae bacterium]
MSRPWRWSGLAAVLALLGAWWLGSGEPAPGGSTTPDLLRLERGNGAEPDSLDPQLARIESALTILRDAYEGLTRVARDGGVEPAVAEAWDVSADGLRYRFALRPDARWSNGDPVTAEDFVAAWQRLVDPATASPYGQLLEPVAGAMQILRGEAALDTLGVVADGPQALVVRLTQPTPYFPALLSHPSTFPIHRPSLQAHGRGFSRAGPAETKAH